MAARSGGGSAGDGYGEGCRILVLGDSGVGKSSLLQALCRCDGIPRTPGDKGGAADGALLAALPRPRPTACVDVWVTVRRDRGRRQAVEFVEVCGNEKYHRSARWPLYHNVNGLMLVHDLADEASLHSLRRWAESYEEFQQQLGSGPRPRSGSFSAVEVDACAVRPGGTAAPRRRYMSTEDAATTPDGCAIPVLVVGTKRDAAGGGPRVECMPKGAGWYPGWRRFVLRVTTEVMRWQRLLARLFSRLLFLPVPHFLREGARREEVEEALKRGLGASFCEWSSADPDMQQVDEVMRFVDGVLEGSAGTGV
eukprot:TRINITY_DN36354_c0_g1_i1.p1 TRINITY_DN36354_c0_g1~~TRINITY_DN36354_c0_g1_i1.p1  ORF type:complete len:338 (+),score=88.88 TRINITY_DN36354_c0_g1_i1:89-1015(+)